MRTRISRKLNKIDFGTIEKIHFIGIGGIGLSAIAKLMLIRGKIVSGSDVNESEIIKNLRDLGANVFIGHNSDNLAEGTDLLIFTLAVGGDNSELIKAKKLKIPILSYPEALGMLFNDKFGIAVCGTHGKSTTAALTGLLLAKGGLDPSVVVGSKVPEFGGNLRAGKSKYFVIEACEYERAFLNYYPKIIVLNNIELDHTDYYKNIADYKSAFKEFIGHLSKDGVLICNGDDAQTSKLKCQMLNQLQSLNVKIISFGFRENNDVRGYSIETESGRTKFRVKYNLLLKNLKNKPIALTMPWQINAIGLNLAKNEIISPDKELGEFTLKIPGKFNVYNALAAIAAGLYLGVGVNKIKKSLAEFGGIWRRFEIKGEYKKALIISDYAHHPTAVKSTIEAARQFYPGKRIVAVFQPHQHNRTKMLYQDFLRSFDSTDALILAEIFDVAGREEKKDQDVSSRKLAEDIKSVVVRSGSGRRSHAYGRSAEGGQSRISCNKRGIAAFPSVARNGKESIFLHSDNIFYASNLAETRKLIDEKIKPGDILLIMGAGDIYKVADELVGNKNKKA